MTANTDIDQIKKDLEVLRNDLSSLTNGYKERVRETAGKAASDLNARAQEGARTVSAQIEANPISSMLIAFGIGLTLGKLFDRR